MTQSSDKSETEFRVPRTSQSQHSTNSCKHKHNHTKRWKGGHSIGKCVCVIAATLSQFGMQMHKWRKGFI